MGCPLLHSTEHENRASAFTEATACRAVPWLQRALRFMRWSLDIFMNAHKAKKSACYGTSSSSTSYISLVLLQNRVASPKMTAWTARQLWPLPVPSASLGAAVRCAHSIGTPDAAASLTAGRRSRSAGRAIHLWPLLFMPFRTRRRCLRSASAQKPDYKQKSGDSFSHVGERKQIAGFESTSFSTKQNRMGRSSFRLAAEISRRAACAPQSLTSE